MMISPPFESTKYSSWVTDMAGMSCLHDINKVVKAKKTIEYIFIIMYFFDIYAVLMPKVAN